MKPDPHALDNNFADAQGLITYEAWELRVFMAAQSYSVVVPLGRGQIETKWYRTYPEAMMIALHTPRSILYASTPTGRAVCITRKSFATYLKIYNDATSQRLKMPADPSRAIAEREPAPTPTPRKRVRVNTEK